MKIIKFHQDSCQPCRMVESFLSDVLKVEVDESYNVWDNDRVTLEMVQNYMIMQTPVILLIDDEYKEIGKSVGFKPSELENLFSKRG
ncbi:thioredoxin family protein [Staphylococcus equorum]|uniref:Thioredoxin family protein n=1 Tax=Staphylococcus equorum TaxID=246432 RepID=A0A9X4LAP9_9STAP|nr:thioredoxin family protein [Staphylococcus equorum]MDG0860371.1 thioredoxin family protein [Staphylococcus equorum]